MQIDGFTIPGFAPNTLNYNVQVPFKTKEITVTATAADAKSTVTVDGGTKLKKNVKKLKDGANTITVRVKAEDGTEQMYSIVAIPARG